MRTLLAAVLVALAFTGIAHADTPAQEAQNRGSRYTAPVPEPPASTPVAVEAEVVVVQPAFTG